MEMEAYYDEHHKQYDLLGVMADAADDNGEPLVAEALRWLWGFKTYPERSAGSGRTYMWTADCPNIYTLDNTLEFQLRPPAAEGDSPTRAVYRLVIGYLKTRKAADASPETVG